MVHSGVVLMVCVHSNRDCNLLARPTIRGALIVIATESTHNVGVVVLDAIRRLIGSVELEEKVVFREKSRHFIVQRWIH